jgi:hypothetical protein
MRLVLYNEKSNRVGEFCMYTHFFFLKSGYWRGPIERFLSDGWIVIGVL